MSGVLAQLISFQIIKVFDLSTVGIVCSLAPIIVCVIGYFFLGESQFCSDNIFLALVFTACVIVLVGAGQNSYNLEPEVIDDSTVIVSQTGVNSLSIMCLIAMPCLISGQAIANRLMKKLGETAVSTFV